MEQWQISCIHEEEVKSMAYKQDAKQVAGAKSYKWHKLEIPEAQESPKQYELGPKEAWTLQIKMTQTERPNTKLP